MKMLRQILRQEIELAIQNNDFSAIEKISEKVDKIVSYDFLTQSLSRWKIEELIGDMIDSHLPDKRFSILMIDVDNFKKINDKHGHNVGDDVLRCVSKIVMSNIRSTDLFGRWGGEEFILVLHDANRSDAIVVGERLRKAIESSGIGATISVGCAQYNKGDNMLSLVSRADKFLYHAKNNGKNRCN